MFLSIDFGTSSVKLSILDENLATLQSEKEEYQYTLLPGEKVEQDPVALWQAMVTACKRLSPQLRKKVELFCYDTFSPSLVLMDECGELLYPIVTHLDRRSRPQSDYICDVMGKDRYQQISGVYPFAGGISLTTVLWFMKQEPTLCEKVKRIGHLPTYVHKKLTGEWMVDMVNASMMGIYDTVRQNGWSDEILETFGVPRHWLSPIYVPGEALGVLRPQIAADLGLTPGIPVAVGTNDVVAAHAGAGNTRSGQILNTAGSSDMVSILTDKPFLHPGYYVRNAGTPGLWQIYATTCGGFSVDWFRKQFCAEMSAKQFFGEFLPSCLPLCSNNPVAFDPYLAEDRQSLERRLASWRGLSLGTTKAQMLAALLYAMQKVLTDTIAEAAKQTNIDRTIKITGGLADAAIMTLKEKMFDGYTFEQRDDCTILGNAALAYNGRSQLN